jgi:hypothetical protein
MTASHALGGCTNAIREAAIVRKRSTYGRQNLEDPLIDVVGPFYQKLEVEGR